MKPGLPYWAHFPGVKLDPKKAYWYGRVLEGQEPPKGKVIRYSRTTRMYLVEKGEEK